MIRSRPELVCSKLAMSSIIVFFVIGLLVLVTVREREGIALAREMAVEVA